MWLILQIITKRGLKAEDPQFHKTILGLWVRYFKYQQMKIIKITLNSNDSLGVMSNLGEMFYKRFEKNKIFKNFPEILHSSAARPLWQDLSDIKFALYSQRHYTIFTLYCYIIILLYSQCLYTIFILYCYIIIL